MSPFPAGIVDQHLAGDIAFSPDGKTLAVANHDGAVKLCDLTTGKVEDVSSPFPHTKQGEDWYNDIVYSKGGRFLAVAYEERAIVIRDVPAMKEKVRIALDGAGVTHMTFTDGDQTLLALLMTIPKDAPPGPGDWHKLTYLAVRGTFPRASGGVSSISGGMRPLKPSHPTADTPLWKSRPSRAYPLTVSIKWSISPRVRTSSRSAA